MDYLYCTKSRVVNEEDLVEVKFALHSIIRRIEVVHGMGELAIEERKRASAQKPPKPPEFGEWKTAWSEKYTRWYWCVRPAPLTFAG